MCGVGEERFREEGARGFEFGCEVDKGGGEVDLGCGLGFEDFRCGGRGLRLGGRGGGCGVGG